MLSTGISLEWNLSSSGLSGEIVAALANLTMIESLDLSYNNLTGAVPQFLASLDNLKLLNLTGNNFTRPLPAELLAKSKKQSLYLSIEVIGDQDKDLAIKDDAFKQRNQQYTYSEVKSITNNFTMVIGKGGFGTVFRGSIGGNQVAVKMLSESSSQGYKQFQAEVKLLMDVRHKNITPLVGYCNDSNHKAIIYEYMSNGNLRQHLFDESSNVLSWERRLQIGCDAAEGLVYMHDGCRPPIVHIDVKPTNILLNEGFQAKLADFGMSRAFTTEDATDESTRIVGTLGYLDPEYRLSNRLTMKSDVYSFGIVLLELITSRRAISENINIINWVKSTIAEGHVEHIIDPKLQGNFNRDTAWKVVELAIACVSYSSIKRPTMNDVVMELKYCLQAEQIHRSIPDNESVDGSGDVSMVSMVATGKCEEEEIKLLGKSVVLTQDMRMWAIYGNLEKAECSNCKFLAEKINTLEAKIKILEGALKMERHPEKHTLESAAILRELYNDMEKLGHYSNFSVLKHIEEATIDATTSAPRIDEWNTADSIVKSWIFLTLSSTLRKRLIKTNPKTAKAAWDAIETIFQDNKRTRTISLKGELRVIQMGDQTTDEYFSKIESILTLLTDLGSTIADEDVVTYAINGLSDKYGNLAQIIAHKDPFPDLSTVRSMVTTEEMRLHSKTHNLPSNNTSSALQILLAETTISRGTDTRNAHDRDNRNNTKTEVCRRNTQNMRTMHTGSTHVGLDLANQQHLLSLLQAQSSLLAQYGMSLPSIQRQQLPNSLLGSRPNFPPGFSSQSAQLSLTPQQQAMVANVQGLNLSTGQETLLPNAFNTMTLQDPANANWNMDTGASSHLNSSTSNLSTIFNSCLYPSVFVGDENSIPVTNTGHSTLPTPYRPLHLNNVLITPNIVKILISVRQFVCDNKCTIEFDEFGFSVKDLWTRQILLRCDSSGDLYPVTSPSYPQALLVSQHTWHQRLGHPGSEVLRNLVSNNFISCNQTKSPVLCHACQLGKHVRLPFSVSETIVQSPFDVIHSDLWTSPLLSCDHGGEFDNNALHQLFASNGITIRFSCPKTSQQNGKSKRMIRTINNLIRTLLFQAYLPPTFWVEALHMAAYLLNILPSTTIQNDIPHTRFFKTTPNYTALRVFGCLCYPHLHTTHKLEPRATPSIFLGYPTNHRGYRCLDLNTNKIILSRHVTFDETIFPYGSMTPNTSPSYTFLDTSPNLIQQQLLSKSTIPLLTPATPQPATAPSNPPSTLAQPTSPTQQPTIPIAHNPHSTTEPTIQPTAHPPPSPSPTNTTPDLQPSTTIPIPTVRQNPNPNPASTHLMVTRYRVGTNKPTQRFTYNVSTISPIPKTYTQAFNDPNWYRAMLDEYITLIKNNTWTLVPRPPDANIVRSLWLFRHKHNADGSLNRYKARLVANGSTQLAGIELRKAKLNIPKISSKC
ncbi:ribonuclease H-like domain-containing protein [Tanacetum coccineum]